MMRIIHWAWCVRAAARGRECCHPIGCQQLRHFLAHCSTESRVFYTSSSFFSQSDSADFHFSSLSSEILVFLLQYISYWDNILIIRFLVTISSGRDQDHWVYDTIIFVLPSLRCPQLSRHKRVTAAPLLLQQRKEKWLGSLSADQTTHSTSSPLLVSPARGTAGTVAWLTMEMESTPMEWRMEEENKLMKDFTPDNSLCWVSDHFFENFLIFWIYLVIAQ